MGLKLFVKLAWQSLCFRRGAVLITVAAIAVSVFTLLSVEHLRQTAKHSFHSTVSGVDLIVGPRTSGINLLLTSVFRIGQPSQNMSWGAYKDLENHPEIAWAIPISLGDSHRGFRVVGTNHQFFTRFQYGQSRNLGFSIGSPFSKINDVVLGASVARQLAYNKDHKLVIAHGLGKTNFQTHDAFPFRVSGILKPTGTPVDNALYVSLAGLEYIHQPPTLHSMQTDSSALQPKSISATMVGLSSKISTFKVQRELNTSIKEPLTAILPGVTLTQLWQMTRGVENALTIMAKLVLFSSLLGLGAVTIATLRERAYELSVLRTLGAGPFTIFLLIQLETLLVSILGIILGAIIFFMGIVLLSKGITIAYGINIGVIQVFALGTLTLYVLMGAIAVGVLPALAGYFRSRRL